MARVIVRYCNTNRSRPLDTQFIIAKEVDLLDKNLFIPIMNEVEEMQSILVATLNKLKG